MLDIFRFIFDYTFLTKHLKCWNDFSIKASALLQPLFMVKYFRIQMCSDALTQMKGMEKISIILSAINIVRQNDEGLRHARDILCWTTHTHTNTRAHFNNSMRSFTSTIT